MTSATTGIINTTLGTMALPETDPENRVPMIAGLLGGLATLFLVVTVVLLLRRSFQKKTDSMADLPTERISCPDGSTDPEPLPSTTPGRRFGTHATKTTTLASTQRSSSMGYISDYLVPISQAYTDNFGHNSQANGDNESYSNSMQFSKLFKVDVAGEDRRSAAKKTIGAGAGTSTPAREVNVSVISVLPMHDAGSCEPSRHNSFSSQGEETSSNSSELGGHSPVTFTVSSTEWGNDPSRSAPSRDITVSHELVHTEVDLSGEGPKMYNDRVSSPDGESCSINSKQCNKYSQSQDYVISELQFEDNIGANACDVIDIVSFNDSNASSYTASCKLSPDLERSNRASFINKNHNDATSAAYHDCKEKGDLPNSVSEQMNAAGNATRLLQPWSRHSDHRLLDNPCRFGARRKSLDTKQECSYSHDPNVIRRNETFAGNGAVALGPPVCVDTRQRQLPPLSSDSRSRLPDQSDTFPALLLIHPSDETKCFTCQHGSFKQSTTALLQRLRPSESRYRINRREEEEEEEDILRSPTLQSRSKCNAFDTLMKAEGDEHLLCKAGDESASRTSTASGMVIIPKAKDHRQIGLGSSDEHLTERVCNPSQGHRQQRSEICPEKTQPLSDGFPTDSKVNTDVLQVTKNNMADKEQTALLPPESQREQCDSPAKTSPTTMTLFPLLRRLRSYDLNKDFPLASLRFDDGYLDIESCEVATTEPRKKKSDKYIEVMESDLTQNTKHAIQTTSIVVSVANELRKPVSPLASRRRRGSSESKTAHVPEMRETNSFRNKRTDTVVAHVEHTDSCSSPTDVQFSVAKSVENKEKGSLKLNRSVLKKKNNNILRTDGTKFGESSMVLGNTPDKLSTNANLANFRTSDILRMPSCNIIPLQNTTDNVNPLGLNLVQKRAFGHGGPKQFHDIMKISAEFSRGGDAHSKKSELSQPCDLEKPTKTTQQKSEAHGALSFNLLKRNALYSVNCWADGQLRYLQATDNSTQNKPLMSPTVSDRSIPERLQAISGKESLLSKGNSTSRLFSSSILSPSSIVSRAGGHFRFSRHMNKHGSFKAGSRAAGSPNLHEEWGYSGRLFRLASKENERQDYRL